MENQQTELLRRDFLKTGLVFSLSLSAILANAYYLLDAEYNLQPDQKERHLTVTPEGYKIGVILGNHGAIDEKTGKIDSARVTRLDIQDLFLPVGAFFNDGWTNSLDPRITGELMADSIKDTIKLAPDFYKAPFEYGLTNDIPFIFGDINLKGITKDQLSETADSSKKAMLSALATMLVKGGEVALDNYSDFLKKKMTRREFLRLLVTGGIVSSIYFSSPALVHVARELGIKPEEQALKDFQAIFSDLIHPDNYAIVMRNIVWALKCRDFFETGIIPKNKVINIPGGLNHRFLDFFLRYPDLAKKYWQLFNYREVAGSLSQGDTSWVNKSRIFYPSTKRTEIIHHGSLNSLVA